MGRTGTEIGSGAVIEGGSTAAGGADGKEFSALGGKISGPGPGVESEKGEAVEAGLESVQLLSVGDGNVDKDAVLQPGKTQIERLETARQKIVLEVFDIGGGLVDGGIEPPGLGLVEKIVDEVQQLSGRVGQFGDHFGFYMKKGW
jgi:hypothetical protein